jgi:hypothetical protein
MLLERAEAGALRDEASPEGANPCLEVRQLSETCYLAASV